MANVCNDDKRFVEKGCFVKKGTTLIEAEPFVAALSTKFRNERCDTCFKSCKIFKCSGCRYVHYCSKNCQIKSWNLHKVECPNLKRVQPLEVPDAARIMARIIIKCQSGGREERGYYSLSEYRIFENLMSHYSDIKQDSKRIEHFTSLYVVLRKFLPNAMLLPSRELLEIYGRMSINSFHILDDKMTSIGVGIYLGPSIIDHSCRANASTIFDGTKLVVRAVRDIPSFDWSKVSISYIDVLRSVEERRENLRSSYYFWCNCDRCNHPEAAAAAAACPNKFCNNPCLPEDLKCGKCDATFPPNFQDDFHSTETKSFRNLERMEKNTEMEKITQLEICRTCLKEQEGVLHPLNMLHVRMLEMALPAASDLELWEEAENYTRKLIEKYEFYYGDTHPLTGDAYLTLAKVLGFGGKLKQAYDVVRKTSHFVKIAFGENHPKMREMDSTAYWLRAECEIVNI